jgi:hypothetical protein
MKAVQVLNDFLVEVRKIQLNSSYDREKVASSHLLGNLTDSIDRISENLFRIEDTENAIRIFRKSIEDLKDSDQSSLLVRTIIASSNKFIIELENMSELLKPVEKSQYTRPLNTNSCKYKINLSVEELGLLVHALNDDKKSVYMEIPSRGKSELGRALLANFETKGKSLSEDHFINCIKAKHDDATYKSLKIKIRNLIGSLDKLQKNK